MTAAMNTHNRWQRRAIAAGRLVIGAESECWPWRGYIDKYGYAQGDSKQLHRRMYELHVGPIPAGHHLDHTCHTNDPSCPGGTTCMHRRCVNPAHLEAVTPMENDFRARTPHYRNAIKTECDNGHPFDAANTYIRPNGHRDCRVCVARRAREYQQRRRSALGGRGRAA